MRRVIMWLIATTAGTTLLIGLKWQGVSAPQVVADAPADPAVVPGPQGTPAPSGNPATTPQATAGAPAATKPPTTTTTTTTAAAAQAAARTLTGVAVPVTTARSPNSKGSDCGDCNNYSIIITIQVTGGRITKITPSYGGPEGPNTSYAAKANTRLNPLALSAQRWSVGNASGATYSANAWEMSLRDAMSKAGLPV